MLPDPNFPQKNFLWTYAPGYDLPAHVVQATNEKGDLMFHDDGRPIIAETITKWKLSKEDIDFVNEKGYIYLQIIGGQPPVCLHAEPIFDGEE